MEGVENLEELLSPKKRKSVFILDNLRHFISLTTHVQFSSVIVMRTMLSV